MPISTTCLCLGRPKLFTAYINCSNRPELEWEFDLDLLPTAQYIAQSSRTMLPPCSSLKCALNSFSVVSLAKLIKIRGDIAAPGKLLCIPRVNDALSAR
jgi:hypothetical protein